jgi:polygalacturonase
MARRLDIVALGRNNDGIDLEMTRHFIVEDCSFDQGGDAIAIKSGRVLENWNTPNSSRYIVIRRCVANRAKAFLSIGEEISHGVHNVYMHNCQAKGELDDFFSIRSNRRQNSQVDSITVEHCEAASLQRIFAIDTDVYGDWRGRMTSGPDSCVATIAGITMRDIKCRRAVALVDINGDAKRPIKDVTIEDLNADSVTSFLSHTTHVIDYKPSAIRARHLGQSSLQPRRPQ